MSAATRLDGQPCAAGWFAVESATMPGVAWSVRYQGGDLRHCFCPAFTRKQTCRHVEAVADAVAAEARAAVANATPEQRAEAAERLANVEELFSR